jgi:hypothetical protein
MVNANFDSSVPAAPPPPVIVDDDDDDVLDPSEQTQRPIDNALNQQRLNAWHPVLDPVFVIVALFYLGVIMVPVGTCVHVSFCAVHMSRRVAYRIRAAVTVVENMLH